MALAATLPTTLSPKSVAVIGESTQQDRGSGRSGEHPAAGRTGHAATPSLPPPLPGDLHLWPESQQLRELGIGGADFLLRSLRSTSSSGKTYEPSTYCAPKEGWKTNQGIRQCPEAGS